MRLPRLFTLPIILIALASCATANVAITTYSLPNGTVGIPYSANIVAKNGCTPYLWAWTGTLPAGLKATSTSKTTMLNLAGTPTTAATYPFTVTVTGCGNKTSTYSYTVIIAPSQTVGVAISPTNVGLNVNTTQQFTATVSGTSNTAVTWTATGGTVNSSGLYTAPATAGTYTVKATSQADATTSASATVVVQAISISISPAAATITTSATQQFTASVSGTSNTSVTWTTSGGTVNSTGLYTAPASAGSYTVKATSQADASKSATATVTVQTIQSVSISVSPLTATVYVGQTQQFAATVNGTTNTAVTWTAAGGTVNSSGLYTAPSTAGTYTVNATSQADTTKTASATVTVNAMIQHTVALNWNESSTVTTFNVYRSMTDGSGYGKIGTSASASYIDNTVTSGRTYFYVTTAIDNTGAESAYSNQATAMIPVP